MNLGFFGGTFDPIHNGHLAVARAALARYKLEKIIFVTTDVPPHKREQPITDYIHRYAMVALALAEEKKFVPSLLEAPCGSEHIHYSVDTIVKLKSSLKKADQLFFIIGIDAFMDIAKWRRPEALLRACEFIVVSRPGHSLSDVANALPSGLRPKTVLSKNAGRILTLPGVTIHLLEGIESPVSATQIRGAVTSGNARALGKMVHPSVADYIKKMHLYEFSVET